MGAAGDGVRIGLLGKLPAHGDFIRRGDLPASFRRPWDAWLEEGMAAARAALGEERWTQVWDAAPAWRFALPAGACGPEAVAGLLLPSRDSVQRRFPLTLAAVTPDAGAAWPPAWFAALEGVGRAALAQGLDADALAAALPWPAGDDPGAACRGGKDAAAAEDPSPAAPAPAMMPAEAPGDRIAPGWWTAAGVDGTPGLVWPLAALPGAEAFVLLLESEA
jgi:type VI secretion system protein ImpM